MMTTELPGSGNIQSVAYFLGMLSNVNSSYPVRKEADLNNRLKKINTVLGHRDVKAFAGEWEIVWGPVQCSSLKKFKIGIIPHKRYVTDNAMYMARLKQGKGKADVYLIGIAGTNGISTTGWWDEDFDVAKTKKWPADFLNLPKKDGGYIARGAYTGLQKLWEKKDTRRPAAKGRSGLTLMDYIRKYIAGSKAEILVAGHSLGGCLTPVVATAIADTLKKDKIDKIKVTAFPFAGPTPGDAAFANHLAKRINYHAFYNESDIVPLTWDLKEDKLNALLDTYAKAKVGGGEINAKLKSIQNILIWVKDLPKPNAYTRKPTDATKPKEFSIQSWANSAITIPESKKKKDIKAVDKAVGSLSSILAGLPSTKESLKKLDGNADDVNMGRVRRLLRFLFEVGMQHIGAYSSKEAAQQVGIKVPAAAQQVLTDSNFYYKPKRRAEKIVIGNMLLIEFATLLHLAADHMSKKKKRSANTVQKAVAKDFEKTEVKNVDVSPFLLSSVFNR